MANLGTHRTLVLAIKPFSACVRDIISLSSSLLFLATCARSVCVFCTSRDLSYICLANNNNNRMWSSQFEIVYMLV